MSAVLDPPPAPETSETLVRAADLKNRVLLLRPTGLGEWPARDDKPAQPFVACDVWVLDRSGIEAAHTDVRFSWWRAVAQLKDRIGQFTACRPVERDDRSVELVPLSAEARKVAEQVAHDLGGVQEQRGYAQSTPDDVEEPF